MAKKEITIEKFIIRVDEDKLKSKADLVGIDKDGNEYTFEYYNSHLDRFEKQNIICKDKE